MIETPSKKNEESIPGRRYTWGLGRGGARLRDPGHFMGQIKGGTKRIQAITGREERGHTAAGPTRMLQPVMAETVHASSRSANPAARTHSRRRLHTSQ